MAVEAQNLVEQLLAETVHHRHDDNQGGHAEHDPEERKSGIDRNESFLPPRPQVAKRQHPLERSERMGAGRLTHSSVPRLPIAYDSGRFTPYSEAEGPKDTIASCDQAFDRIGRAHQLAAAISPLLELDFASGKPFRPYQDLPGNADQIGAGEFRAWSLVEVIIEHVESFG